MSHNVKLGLAARQGLRGIPTKMAAEGTDGAALRKVFSKLVEELKAVDIIDQLYEIDLLSNEEYEGILDTCSQASSKEDSKTVNRRVLMAIRRRPPGFAAKLVDILRKKYPYRSLADALEKGACLCTHVCSVICEVSSYPPSKPNFSRYCFCLAALADVSSRPGTDPAPAQDPRKDVHSSSSGSGVSTGTVE